VKNLLILLCLLCTNCHLSAQDVQSWEEYFNRMGQLEDAESADWEQTYDELSEVASDKLDLNRCTREDLQRLPFLSEQQIMDIMEYRERAGRFESPIELRLIPSLETRDIDMLQQFIILGSEARGDTIPSLSNILHYGKNELVGTVKIPFYKRKGDVNGYLGYPYKHWLRYTFSYGQRVKAGVVASQDAGEPFFALQNNTGYDFYSAYILLRDMGRVKTLALGRYRLRFGMGLVMNTSFGLGKLNTLAMLGRSGNYVYAHSSRSEANYLQGAAATITVMEGLDATAFVSWRKIDATLNKDSTSVATILKTGYHRTPSEMNRRCNTSQQVMGGNINYLHNGFHIGVTGYLTSFNRELIPKTTQSYRRWYPAGSRFWNLSMDYGYLSNRLNIAGETAIDDGGAIATLNSISYQFTDRFSLMGLQRYYTYQYHTLFGESFAEGGAVNNESGLYLGANWVPIRGLSMMLYTDLAYFAWPKYQAATSSRSWDNFMQAVYEHGRLNMLVRYRLKMRDYDNEEKTALLTKYEHRGRVAVGYDSDVWSTRTQADLSFTSFTTNSLGFMVSQFASYRIGLLRLQAAVGYFDTDDYNSRVYIYEPSVLYNFSFPSFYGNGIRCSMNARADLGKRLMVIAKLGITHYFDRSSISSGLQEISSKGMTDLELQVRWKF